MTSHDEDPQDYSGRVGGGIAKLFWLAVVGTFIYGLARGLMAPH